MGEHLNVKILGEKLIKEDTGISLEPPQLVQVVAKSNAEDTADARSGLSCIAVERQAVVDGNLASALTSDDVESSKQFTDDSFRSEDNEALALWEEKEKSPKAVSSEFSWLKPGGGAQLPWLGSVSNAMKKIEMLSHAWARSSAVDPKPTSLDVATQSLEYLNRVNGRSTWKDRKIVSTTVRSSETALYLSSKVSYTSVLAHRRPNGTELPFSGPISATPVDDTSVSAYRRPNGTELPFSGPISATPIDFGSPSKLRHSVSCENISGSSRAVALNRSLQSKDESKPSLRSGSNREEVADPPRTIAAAVGRAVSRRIQAEAVSSSRERYSASRRSHSMNEAMLIDCGIEQAREGNSNSHETREPKTSLRYYDKIASRRKKSSCWNSFDNTHLDRTTDSLAPSAARLMEDERSECPVRRHRAVPFKWEKEPGKAKETESHTTSGQLSVALPLPPRLSVGHCSSVSSTSFSHHQCSSPLPSSCGNATISGSLREHYALPSPKNPSSESHKVLLPWFSTSFGNSSSSLRAAFAERPERGSCTISSAELPMRKSKSVGEVRNFPHSYSRGNVGDEGKAQKPCTKVAKQPDQQKPVIPSGVVRPSSPTSILCGPDAGRRSSCSDPSVSSEHEVPRISASASSTLSQSGLPALISLGSIDCHRIDNSSELLLPGSSLSSPIRSTFRSISGASGYNPDFEEMHKYLNNTEHQRGADHSESSFVKFCKVGRRWMRTKSQAKLGTNPSPEIWTPSIVRQQDTYSDFSARLGEGSSRSQAQTEGYFPRITSARAQEDLGNGSAATRWEASAASLGLLSTAQKPKSRQTRPPSRTTWKSNRILQTRARLRAQFIIPVRRTLKTLLTSCTLRHGSKNVKVVDPKLAYQYHIQH